MMNTLLLWVKITALCIISCIIAQISLFAGIAETTIHASYTLRIVLSVCFLLIQLMFMVPFIENGILIMSPVQLVLYVFFWTFVVQLIINVYVLKNVNTLDDYIAIVCILIGMSISRFRLFT